MVKSLRLRDHKVFVEPHFQTQEGLLKLDILGIRKSDNVALIIDHTVVWDNGDLCWHALGKEGYYDTEDIKVCIWQLHPSV